mmetsp:Transcript_20749/g.43420  ORF Transcript_20749/g.43420 Transcript_20749/m.43420 type:complete len:210 (-) Transcript_20749:239-868(-)
MSKVTPNTPGTSSSGPSAAQATALGNALWNKQAKANAELLALTYGAMVGELLRDLESPTKINDELDRMGHSMGIRCIEEFLAKSALETQSSLVATTHFGDSAYLLQAALKMFWGVAVESTAKSQHSYTLRMAENPLDLFVELPPNDATSSALEYSQLWCGMVRGMLEMLQFDVTCKMIQSQLKGQDTNEMVVDLKQVLQEGAGDDYHEE